MESSLNVQPVDGRVGTVCTLDHPPNLNGLVSLFDELQRRAVAQFRFRLVGQPSSFGATLAARYPFVEYLGPLSDNALRAEAATWCCFTHPMFVYAKGCSTKLGTALGWGLPIATTVFGARGYTWDEQLLPLSTSAPELAQAVFERSKIDHFERHQKATLDIVRLMPTVNTVGNHIRDFLTP